MLIQMNNRYRTIVQKKLLGYYSAAVDVKLYF